MITIHTILITLFILFLTHLALTNRERKFLYRVGCDHSFTRREVMIYVAFVAVVLIALLLGSHSAQLHSFSSLLSILILGLAMYLPVMLYRSRFVIYYSKDDSQVFRSDLDTSKSSKSSRKGKDSALHQVTMMPLYKDEARTKPIGKLYSSAEIVATGSDNEVMQITTYVFDGVDVDFPQGTVVMSISNPNTVKNIFPPDGVYRGHILTGSGAYEGITGVVDVNITGSERQTVFSH
jgi:hypothetical protein